MRNKTSSNHHLLTALHSHRRRAPEHALDQGAGHTTDRSGDEPGAGTQHNAGTLGSASSAFRRCPRRQRQAFIRPALGAVLIAAAHVGLLATPAAMAQQADVVVAETSLVAQVNINTATADELALGLRGVGASKAEAIVRYREQFGRFTSIEELAEVTGIGAATIERNRDVIRLQ